jgi:intracellular sulfur oxidation DsrE/DsrF family protein
MTEMAMPGSNDNRRKVLGAGALMAATGVAAPLRAQVNGDRGLWEPAFEPADAWLDKPGTRHRMVFDTTSMDTAVKGIHFANNFYVANETGYGLGPETLGVVVVLRAEATPLGYSDVIWAKYGEQLAKIMSLTGDKAKVGKQDNPLLSSGDRNAVTLTMLRAKGARFAICGMATHGMSGVVAKAMNGDAGAIEAEIKANLVPGALLVPAGIIAVNRAQEHGYALAYVS